jgi:hypothetical protein
VHPMQQAAHALPPAARPILPVTDVAAVTKAFAVAAAHPSAAASATGAAPIAAASTASQAAPTFNSLFSDQDRRTAVDPLVVALWSVPASEPQPNGAQAAPTPAIDPQIKNGTGASRFDLFQDVRPDARALFGGSS